MSNVNKREVSVLAGSTVVQEVVCRSNELSYTARSFILPEGHSTRKPLRFRPIIFTVVPPAVTLRFSSGNWRI